LASAKWPASWGAISSRNIPAIATTTRRASMWLSDYRVFLDIGPCPAVGLEDLIEGPATAWERAERALDHPDDAAERDIAGHERVHRLLVGRVQDRRVYAAVAGRLASQADAGQHALLQPGAREPAGRLA